MSSLPMFAPSTWKRTPATATLSLAMALMLMVPVNVAPAVGLVIDALGAVESPRAVPAASLDGKLTFPAASCAVTL